MNPITESTTIPDLLRNVVGYVHEENTTFLTHKVKDSWVEISYKQVLDTADAISAYFLEMGINKGDRLALIIENSVDWVYYDQGVQQIGAINVSVYPTLSESEIEYILNDSSAKTILAGNPFLFRKLIKIADNCPELQRIIPVFDDYEKYLPERGLNAGVISFSNLIEEGKNALERQGKKIEEARAAILPSDLTSLIYTSGTTGIPKGVMLTHSNFVQNVKVCLEQIPVINENDVFLSFLPLSHVFERTATYHVCCAVGSKIAFAQSLELLAKNMAEVKPTIMSCVPRLLERIHDKAMKNGTSAGGLKSKIFLWSIETGQHFREVQEAGKTPGMFLSMKKSIAEKLVFSKIKEKTGGRLKFMLSGGAALPKNVGEFFGNLGIKILEGFGLTETSPVMSVTEYHRQVYGTVGRIIPGIEVAIQDVESKKILTIQTHDTFDENFECPEGEIIVRGHCVMKGYWNKPQETAEVIDQDGWFHTGDIGRYYRGNLQITDRIKNMLVNAYGKNIYPTPVENTYLKSSKIEQIFLIGDKREYVTAILIPSKEVLQETFHLNEEFFQEKDSFIRDQKILDWLNEDIRKYSTELAKFERMKSFLVKRTPFSIEEGEITPTMKAKRKVIENKYSEDISEMYLQDTEAD
ncbi:MAG: AMP-binding protein [Sphingobacteriales bacterium 17-39-43]|uniref:AMP-dependent synthetase/ligase n=1 Tax=Daejeonella sp. TaxID=2805397 RepID=UPI000BDB8983|nr:long-chain fatty acid--CoA ligase [Daejeonella sp.]OYZ29532.1 MAG: AMP-binding protein [Sphingobacteriales bacterium 16-39-50]OZA22661.1 MAG: AMP-binding protein [Sphingobacteriales bacterium 17-39-43]HQT24425.1 long-chain fatty acid--CoA ligase [Daejeonella sp.]HQT58728.1 long-chain fatty acid--CoA ligase [Daejeonella sp.]